VESAIVAALVFGLISAVTLPLGAALGVAWRPPDRFMAVLLAFGGGALLAALTIDLIAPGVDRGHFDALASGALLGGLLFKLLDWSVNRQGGYLRKPSTALNFWRGQARRRLRQVLTGMRRTRPLGDLPDAVLDGLLPLVQIRDVPAHSCLYRASDPASNIYVILDGRVELTDPRAGGRVFERLGPHDAFGRMSFLCGLRRATEAHTATAAKLLVIPREAFMELVADSAALRDLLRGLLAEPELERYLIERYGLTAEAVASWRTKALIDLEQTGRYDPPINDAEIAEEPIELMRDEARLGFFPGLSDASLRAIASRLVHKTNPDGYNYFHRGQRADRLYLLRRGTVYLFEPDQRARQPLVVEAGEAFGGLAFFTAGNHTVTAVSHGETGVSELRRKDLDALLEQSAELRERLAAYLKEARVSAYLTKQHHLEAKRAAAWVDRAAKSAIGGRTFPSLSEMTSAVAGHSSAAIAMFLGMALDGIRRQRGAVVVRIEDPLRQGDRLVRDVFVGDLIEQMMDAVQACALLVVALDDIPGRFRDVGARERVLLGLGVVFPPHPGL
jgi:CRP-like cAMP-binding protein